MAGVMPNYPGAGSSIAVTSGYYTNNQADDVNPSIVDHTPFLSA